MHTITADYNGDSNFTGSTAEPLTESVSQAAATIALTASSDSSVFGEPVTFTVAVAPLLPATSTPTGTVTFKEGLVTLGTSALDSTGHATFTRELVAGAHTLSASYSGDVNFTTADAEGITQTVNPAAAATTVTSSANPSPLGQPLTLTLVVRPSPPIEAIPTGTVTLRDGATMLGTASLDPAGVAALTLPALASGHHSIMAIYHGDINFTSNTSPALSETVTSTPNEAFVTALYRDVLKRAPDTAGFQFWVEQLQAGATRATVANAFETSAEYRGLEVDQFYDTFFHRSADPSGRGLWVNALVAGRSEADVVVAFLTSTEYTVTHRDSASYVNGLYQDVLGHSADPNGAGVWKDLLERGVLSRNQLALSFLSSTEAYVEAVDSYYTTFLGRPADAAGREAYLLALENARFAPTGITTAFLASDEFLARAIASAS
jgi:hypothetical protein